MRGLMCSEVFVYNWKNLLTLQINETEKML